MVVNSWDSTQLENRNGASYKRYEKYPIAGIEQEAN